MKSDQPLYIPSWIQSSRERDLKRFEVKLAEAQQRLKDRSKVYWHDREKPVEQFDRHLAVVADE